MSQHEAMARVICHIYVARMPARSLQELYQTLQDMYEFYHETPVPEQKFLPQPKEIKGQITTSTVRPDFAVDYDGE